MVLNQPASSQKALWLASFLLVLAIFIFSCNDNYIYDTGDCTDCLSAEPYYADLYIEVSLDDENEIIPVVVLRGKLESHDTLLADTIRAETGLINVPLGNYYTVVATYHSGNKNIKVVDGDEINKNNISNICGDVCWVIKGGFINVSR